MTKKNKYKNDIRRSKKTRGHPAYIYKREGDTYKFVSLTHAPITRGVKNIPLDKNPNPSDLTQSYVRPYRYSDNIKNFSRKLMGWKLKSSDRVKVNKIKKGK